MNGDHLARGLGVAAAFAVLGPVVGAVIGLIVLAAAMAAADAGSGLMALAFWPWALLIGAAVGFLPALVTGVVMALVSSRLKAGWLWVSAGGACGLAVTLLTQRFTGAGGEAFLIPGTGMASAILCALATLSWRPR